MVWCMGAGGMLNKFPGTPNTVSVGGLSFSPGLELVV